MTTKLSQVAPDIIINSFYAVVTEIVTILICTMNLLKTPGYETEKSRLDHHLFQFP
jgi:hypothetical protein